MLKLSGYKVLGKYDEPGAVLRISKVSVCPLETFQMQGSVTVQSSIRAIVFYDIFASAADIDSAVAPVRSAEVVFMDSAAIGDDVPALTQFTDTFGAAGDVTAQAYEGLLTHPDTSAFCTGAVTV